uniref:Uncharacterized protein n=1 Tax=Rhizophora mucronata TaxID=61149 RepID=A0A2P2QGE3_RHIMU
MNHESVVSRRNENYSDKTIFTVKTPILKSFTA